MIPKELEQCLILDGYKKARVYRMGLLVYYKFIDEEVYAIALYDYNHCEIQSMEQLIECARNIRASFYHQSSTENVNLLQIFCILDGQNAKDVCYGYDETWLYEVNSQRLVIFENQKGEFLNVRPLIEQMKDEDVKEKFRARRFIPVVTITLIAINVIMFLLDELTGGRLIEWGAMRPFLFFEEHQYYRIISEMFLHFGIGHILNNMVVLLIMGKTLEEYVGHTIFLGYYMFSGITAGLVSLFYNNSIDRQVVSAGASGAIFGIVGVVFFIILINKGKLEGFTIRQMVMFIVLSIYTGVTSPSIDFMAHAGGFMGGFLMALLVAAASMQVKDGYE